MLMKCLCYQRRLSTEYFLPFPPTDYFCLSPLFNDAAACMSHIVNWARKAKKKKTLQSNSKKRGWGSEFNIQRFPELTETKTRCSVKEKWPTRLNPPYFGHYRGVGGAVVRRSFLHGQTARPRSLFRRWELGLFVQSDNLTEVNNSASAVTQEQRLWLFVRKIKAWCDWNACEKEQFPPAESHDLLWKPPQSHLIFICRQLWGVDRTMNSNFQSNTQELFPALVVAPPPALVCVSLSLANPSFIASFWSMLEPCGLGPLKPLILHLQMQSLHTQTHTHTTECSHCIHDGDPLCTPEHIKLHGGAGGRGGHITAPYLGTHIL